VAVIDSLESGQLIGNLSISDLRGLQPETFEQLAQPVGDFLLEGGWREGGPGRSPRWHPNSPRCFPGSGGGGGGSSNVNGGTGGGVAEKFGIRSPELLPHAPALAACQLGSRFSDTLDQLVQGHLHRLFLVDGEGQPAGVVSSTDILRLLVGAGSNGGGTIGMGTGSGSEEPAGDSLGGGSGSDVQMAPSQ